MGASRSVSRILYGLLVRKPKDVVIIHLGCQLLGTSAQPTRTTGLETGRGLSPALSLLGLAPDGVYHATAIAGTCGGLLPHPFTLTGFLAETGGLLSAALSLGLAFKTFPQPGFTRHRVSREPGLSSTASFRTLQQQSPDRLANSM